MQILQMLVQPTLQSTNKFFSLLKAQFFDLKANTHAYYAYFFCTFANSRKSIRTIQI